MLAPFLSARWLLVLASAFSASAFSAAPRTSTRVARGTPLRSAREEPPFLCEEHVDLALAELKAEYDAVFHQDPSLRMSGDVRLASIDGCDVTLRLVGMFWHSRPVVFDLARRYCLARIPEIADVLPLSPENLNDDRTQAPDLNGDRLEIERLGHEPDEVVVIRHRPGLTFTGYNIY